MKTLFIDCNRGAAGDMITAALLQLCINKQQMLDKLNKLLPNLVIEEEILEREGIIGAHLRVVIAGEEEKSYDEVEASEYNFFENKGFVKEERIDQMTIMISNLAISNEVKKQAIEIYLEIKNAEAKVHGCRMEEIHNSRLGSLDAVVDIVSVCVLLESLAITEVVSTPINLGGGFVRCGQWTVPVPAPATAQIVKTMPTYMSDNPGELCTPTGAAIIKHITTRYQNNQPMRNQNGYGLGAKEYHPPGYVKVSL
ncbi:uncharacterized protein (DUF111 family) [Lachnospiraceae bacterium PF1-22]|uniref:nickel insertion protein n=1 Tax=Ohessyouella blattaphilus TaxID=2949333 RepID=UPI003E191C1A